MEFNRPRFELGPWTFGLNIISWMRLLTRFMWIVKAMNLIWQDDVLFLQVTTYTKYLERLGLVYCLKRHIKVACLSPVCGLFVLLVKMHLLQSFLVWCKYGWFKCTWSCKCLVHMCDDFMVIWLMHHMSCSTQQQLKLCWSRTANNYLTLVQQHQLEITVDFWTRGSFTTTLTRDITSTQTVIG